MLFSPENAISDFRRKVKELWNIPKKNYYLLFNGAYESKTPENWSKITAVQVKIKGLLGGGKRSTLTIFFEEEECGCKTTQTFRQAAEDRDLEIRGDSLISSDDGSHIDIGDKIGDHFGAGETVTLYWDVPDKEEETDEAHPYKNAIDLHYHLDDERREMIIGRGHTMRTFMSDNWEEIEWGEFRFQGKQLDPDTPLLTLADEQLGIRVEILTQAELDREREYEEELAQWNDQEEEEAAEETSYPEAGFEWDPSCGDQTETTEEPPRCNGSPSDETREQGGPIDGEGSPAERCEEHTELHNQNENTEKTEEDLCPELEVQRVRGKSGTLDTPHYAEESRSCVCSNFNRDKNLDSGNDVHNISVPNSPINGEFQKSADEKSNPRN
jgi:hypothetical protein